MSAELVAPPHATMRNEVVLAGRLAAPAEERLLPSGTVLVTFRVIVDRPPPARPATPRPPSVDTIDCVAGTAPVRRAALGWLAGDVVEVSGALRRRFWRAGAGAASRTEVEVTKARRLARASPGS
ncbi:MAG TPA: single-stranded DNA-binding protein [Mycobacteriales bacterium]